MIFVHDDLRDLSPATTRRHGRIPSDTRSEAFKCKTARAVDPILAALGSRKQTDRRYADHMYDVALLQAVYGIRLHSQSRYDSCTELSDHFRTDMLSRLRCNARWPLRRWSSGGQWQRPSGSHARGGLVWTALRPRAVWCGHFLASRSRQTRGNPLVYKWRRLVS